MDETGCRLDELPIAMDYREMWKERVMEIPSQLDLTMMIMMMMKVLLHSGGEDFHP